MNIHVSNLSADTTREELRKAFAAHGDVSSAEVLTEERRFGRMVGPSKGYGFVVMPDSVRARAAIAALDRHELRGSVWNVKQARSRLAFGRRLPS
jgi:RNA recognition motif-containing protein